MTKHSDSPGSEDLFLTLLFFEQERRGTFGINGREKKRGCHENQLSATVEMSNYVI